MTGSQKIIIEVLDKLLEPLEKHVASLEEICKDPERTVAKDFLTYYKSELLEWKQFKLMLMEEFIGR